MLYGDVGKLVTPVDCKSAARKALLVRLQSSPPRQIEMFAYAVPLSQCFLVSMGDIETNTNTKAIPSNMSRWKPTRERLPGLQSSVHW